MAHLFAIVGWHNAGKTTLAEALVREYRRRGERVAVIKHSREGFSLDHPGTDTYRLSQAGSDVVAIVSSAGFAWMERPVEEPSLGELVDRLATDIDVIIAEGFKRERCPKIEVMRPETGTEPIASIDELVAIVSDEIVDTRPVPRFQFADAAKLVDYLIDSNYGAKTVS
ncbi:MAG: molybdopterin-guanine dinucleotide biosynthesis protein B [Chloroflexi bacterium]|nr:molybdopterin-guanine dinucleotide biosynthesis protein B [Chloroflexota bacterium]